MDKFLATKLKTCKIILSLVLLVVVFSIFRSVLDIRQLQMTVNLVDYRTQYYQDKNVTTNTPDAIIKRQQQLDVQPRTLKKLQETENVGNNQIILADSKNSDGGAPHNESTDNYNSTAFHQEFNDGHLVHKEYVGPTNIPMLAVPRVDCARDHTFLVLLLSTGTNEKKRDRVRSTWGNTTIYRNMTQRFNLQFIFVIGELELTPELKAEARRHGDLWVGRFEDNYVYLAKKGIFVLDWLNRTCDVTRYVDFILKTDDDVYVNLMRLLPKLWNMTLSEYQCHFVCVKLNNSKVFRSGKWSENRILWPPNHWPLYCQGIGYFITKLGFPLVVKGMHSHYLLTNEDVFLTGVAVKNVSNFKDGKLSPLIYTGIPGWHASYPGGGFRFAMLIGNVPFRDYKNHVMSHNIDQSQWDAIHHSALKFKTKYNNDDVFLDT